MENNFKCKNPDCKAEHKIPKFNIVFKSSGNVYKDRQGNEIKCNCGSKLEEIPANPSTIGVPSFGKFASMSTEEKKEALKKRSSEHFNREVREVQDQMHKDTFNNFLGK